MRLRNARSVCHELTLKDQYKTHLGIRLPTSKPEEREKAREEGRTGQIGRRIASHLSNGIGVPLCNHISNGIHFKLCLEITIGHRFVTELLDAIGWFLSTWAVPEGSFAFAAGNQASCSFQGFLLQIVIGAPLYNCALAYFFFLVVKFDTSSKDLARMEKYVHGLIITFAVGTSILLLPLEQYNHIGTVCWILRAETAVFRLAKIIFPVTVATGHGFTALHFLTVPFGFVSMQASTPS